VNCLISLILKTFSSNSDPNRFSKIQIF